MRNIRSFLGSVKNRSRFKINSDLSKFGFTQTSAGFDKFRSYINNGSKFLPKTELENTYKELFNESKLGNIKNGNEIAKVAFKISRHWI